MSDRYAFNIIFNILNKSALNIFTCPYLMSAMQLGKLSHSSDQYVFRTETHEDTCTKLRVPAPYILVTVRQ